MLKHPQHQESFAQKVVAESVYSGVVDFHSEWSPIPPGGQHQSDSACSRTDEALGQTVTLGNQLKTERFKA